MSDVPDREAKRRRWLGWGALSLALMGARCAIVAEQVKETNDRHVRVAAITDGGDIERGQQLFQDYGCGACHSMVVVPQAAGMVGPPLEGFGSRAVIAGKLANNPDNLRRWIMDPQSVTPGTLMPRLGVGDRDGRDLAAFLYSRS